MNTLTPTQAAIAAGRRRFAQGASVSNEEARAVAAMLAGGLTEDGAAQALGWSKARVTGRVKILAPAVFVSVTLIHRRARARMRAAAPPAWK